MKMRMKHSKKGFIQDFIAIVVAFLIIILIAIGAFIFFSHTSYQQNTLQAEQTEQFDINYMILQALRGPIGTDSHVAETIGELVVMSYDTTGEIFESDKEVDELMWPGPIIISATETPKLSEEELKKLLTEKLSTNSQFVKHVRTKSSLPKAISNYRDLLHETLDEFKVYMMPENKQLKFSYVEEEKGKTQLKDHIILPYPSGSKTKYLKVVILDTEAVLPEVGEE